MHKTYKQKYYENYSNPHAYDINFIINYVIGYFSLTVSYIILTFIPTQENIVIQYTLILAFIAMILRFVLKQKELIEMSLTVDIPLCSEDATSKENITHSFPKYKEQLDKWMQNEKPYLDPNFQMNDIMKALPLNRTYISRLLNQGYEEKFSSFVMRHRIEHSIALMRDNPTISIREVSGRSGFTSPSVYGRTFKSIHGLTPAKFKETI